MEKTENFTCPIATSEQTPQTKEHICVQTGIACGFPCFDGCPIYKDQEKAVAS